MPKRKRVLTSTSEALVATSNHAEKKACVEGHVGKPAGNDNLIKDEKENVAPQN